MGEEDLEKHQSEWEERTKSMKTRAIKDRTKLAKQQRKEKQERDKLPSSALVVSEDSNTTSCERKENEGKESKVLQSELKNYRHGSNCGRRRDKLHVLFRDRLQKELSIRISCK